MMVPDVSKGKVAAGIMQTMINRELISVITVMGLGVLAISMLQPILPLYLTAIGVSPEVLGLMFSVAMVGMVIGESGWGWVADRIGIRLPLTMGTTVCAVVVICFVFTTHIILVFLIFFVNPDLLFCAAKHMRTPFDERV